MSYEPSKDARAWLSDYHGSIDSTALLLAYDAGRIRTRQQLGFAEAAITAALSWADAGNTFEAIKTLRAAAVERRERERSDADS